MVARLPTHLLVSALLRRINDAGGFAVVRARGDADSGGILILLEREDRLIERMIGMDGRDALTPAGLAGAAAETPDDYWQRRRARDPDLWVVALDVADGERFAAETICIN
ncbi:DUF1491 family protein [Sphingomonas sp. NBWT7]|uniref:DUF1491 family protein n=1 Tax=Sphingomonas sp. NBWT7 TaxID=2596913 RepID=UPI001629324B|nr:DUF1491 family protein [Sphingomonas sp. NBWT7]QNE33483.1 DUF1491 family protein [Sphingomonas sp. NBWT7]